MAIHEPPSKLHVKVPGAHCLYYDGECDLVLGERSNGHPVWRNKNGYWLFTTADGFWAFGSGSERDSCVDWLDVRTSGPHKGSLPHQVSQWEEQTLCGNQPA